MSLIEVRRRHDHKPTPIDSTTIEYVAQRPDHVAGADAALAVSGEIGERPILEDFASVSPTLTGAGRFVEFPLIDSVELGKHPSLRAASPTLVNADLVAEIRAAGLYAADIRFKSGRSIVVNVSAVAASEGVANAQ